MSETIERLSAALADRYRIEHELIERSAVSCQLSALGPQVSRAFEIAYG